MGKECKKNNKIILTIKDGDYLSLNDIQQLKERNCSILRSAHVGNLDSKTIFLAKEGFSVILDEYARGTMRVYRPAYKIMNENEVCLSNRDDLPCTHLYLNTESNKNNNCVATFHYNNLLSLFPNSIKLTSSHLLKQKTLVLHALKILAKKRPHSFARLIEKDGRIFKYSRSENKKIYFVSDYNEERIFEICRVPDLVISGLEYTEKLLQGKKVDYSPIITLDVDSDVSLITLCDINWDNINSEDDNIKAIHFSGLEMINYMVKNKDSSEQHTKDMNEIFNLLVPVWTKVIPKKIEILIVPTSCLYYYICGTKEEQRILDEYFNAKIKISKLQEIKKTLWKNHQMETSKYVSSLSDEDIIALIKNIEPTNAPESFIKTLYDVIYKLNKGIKVEREKLSYIAFNHLLYKNMESAGITEIEYNINKEMKSLEKAKMVNSVELTQYDLMFGKKIYFPDTARSVSLSELQKEARKINRNENKSNDKDFCNKVRKAPRLNELLDNFEQIAKGNTQVPYKLPETNKKYLSKSNDYLRHEKIFCKNLGTFFKHGISSIPYLAEEILRVDYALVELAKYKGATTKRPLTYWETSSADGTRARTLAEYSDGVIVTLTDSPNLGNKLQFEKSLTHHFSFFYYGAFVDICPRYLMAQKFHPSFRNGFDVIWENTTFQMYGNNREEQIEYISKSLKKDGLLILFEKLNSENYDNYNYMEKIKDEFKSCYFKLAQIKKKKENILDTMEKGQVTKIQLINAASKFYKYGALIWNSANFYEIVVSNSKDTIEKFLEFLPNPYVPEEFKLEEHEVCCLWGDFMVPNNKQN